MSRHERFIKTSLETVILDALSVSSWCTGSVEEYPLSEYVLQSLFLKMTGFGEQKLKCILWEIATADYEFRNSFLRDMSIGECSCYKEKNKVLSMIVDCIGFQKIDAIGIRNNLVSKVTNICISLFEKSTFRLWIPREYSIFEKQMSLLFKEQVFIESNKAYSLFLKKDNLAQNHRNFVLFDAFEHMYKHRNRCAHNLLSFQENLPSLQQLNDEDYEKYDNWFVRFWILLLLDELFIRLYDQYVTNSINNY